MNRLAVLLVLPALGAAPAAPAPIVVRESRIESAVVYAERAEVTRRFEVDLPAGGSEVLVEGLLPNLDPATLSAGAEGQGIRILAVSSEVRSVERPIREEEARLEEEIREKTREERGIQDGLVVRAERNLWVEGYREHLKKALAQASTAPGPRPAEWRAALDLLSGEEGKATAEARDLERRRFDARKAREALERRLQEIRAPRPQESRAAVLAVEAERAGRAVMRLRYAVAGASWSPRYELRLSSAARRVDLAAFAVVRQETGEDWTGLRLAVSTRRPEAGLKPPPLPALHVAGEPAPKAPARILSAYEAKEPEALKGEAPPAPAGGAAPGAAAPPPPAVPPAAAASVPAEERPVSPRAEAGDAAVEWAVAGPAAVPSAPRAGSFPLGAWRVAADVSIEAVPKRLLAAYRRADLENPAPLPLLAGPADLYLDGAFVGRTDLPGAGPGEPISVSFGAADEIAVSRDPDRVSADRKARRFGYGARIVLSNLSGAGAKVRVIESIPVSRSEGVSVTLSGDTTGRGKEIAPGVLAWDVDLPKGAEKVVRVGYEIQLKAGYSF